MATPFNESGMDFVSDKAFHIEKSQIYTNIGASVKSIEFIRLDGDKLMFIEAKTTFPNPNNPDADNVTRFQSEIEDMRDKFIHSLNLFSSMYSRSNKR